LCDAAIWPSSADIKNVEVMAGAPTSGSTVIVLVREHRTDSVKEGHIFPSMASATQFFQDYNFNRDKAIKKSSHGSKSAAYVCTDARCSWNAVLYRQKNVSGSAEYYVRKLTDIHSDACASFRHSTKRQLKLLRTFSSAVAIDKSVSRRHIQVLLQERVGVNTQSLRSTIYRTRDELVEDNDIEWSASFSLIRFLLLFCYKTPGTHVALDLDTDSRCFGCSCLSEHQYPV